MKDPSNWRDANPGIIVCPKCGETLTPHVASLITQETDGSYSCASCATNFRPPRQGDPHVDHATA